MGGTLWWQTGVIYQVLVRSFQDSNGDGQGDLRGLIDRLDYIQALGVDAIWLSPIYASPWADCGYDVADFDAIHPAYGTAADFDRLIDEAHRRNFRVILDWVPNHTSDQHPWFAESRAVARKLASRLVFVGRPGAGGRAAQQLAERLWRQHLDSG